MILVAMAIFTLVLCRSRKSCILYLKNITLCTVCSHFVFLILQKVFATAFDRYVWIKISFFWCILVFVGANWWVIRIYVKTNCFGVTLMRRRIFAPAIFSRCYWVNITLTLSTSKFNYHSIRFQFQCSQKHWITYACSYISFSQWKEIFSRRWSTSLITFNFPLLYINLIDTCW